MKIQSISHFGEHKKSSFTNPPKHSNSVSFKASTVWFQDGIDNFIRATKSDPERITRMFDLIIENFKKVKSSHLLFKVQPITYKKPAVNITAEIKSYESRKALAKKYKYLLTLDELEKINKDEIYMSRDLSRPLEIFKKQSTRDNAKFTIDFDDDISILDSVQKRFRYNSEGDIFLKFVRREQSLGTRIWRWLDTHGPDFQPIN